ncbi:growth arrest and DNA damage-inducible protein GADD45 alpha-like [Anneissia japonica]|uniref:growth arrest and DNA damage-inducible protein GADD45 alpha-like n=1 Tax=Anneissia japonica TaxID=1529436 RepID=UPI001425B781|nr:growth arrest and DNA damage-inducible protein GADD45 alpha-like [Anneissia japonica]
MTLEDTDQNTLVHSTEKQNNNNKMDLSESLKDVIVKAVADDRVTFGVYDSARKLDKESENVLVCIQVEDTNLDVALEMHLTLLEAFCSESEIKLVKVTNHGHLVQLLDSVRAKHGSGRDLSGDDVVCMVIEEPNETDGTCVSFTEIYHTQEYSWHPHVAL